MTKTGFFISIEGIDGCGKTTLINSLKEKVIQHNIPTVFTKEPGGSAIGKPLREMLNHQPVPLDPKTEYLLFAADRAQHIRDVIMPGIERGELVITDRCADSSLAYQGYGLGLDKDMITQVNQWAMNGISPDMVIYLRITPEKAKKRFSAREDKRTTFELRPITFWEQVIEGYENIFKNRQNVAIIDASASREQVLEDTWKALQKFL